MLNHSQIQKKAGFAFLLSMLFAMVAGSATAQETGSMVEQIEQQSRPVTLDQAINMALANNIEIKRALLNLKDADQQVRLAWSEVLPELTGNATYTRNLELPVIFIPQDFTDPNSPLVPITAGTDNTWRGNISATQTLFRGEAVVGISSSKLYKEAQAENLRATTQQVVTETRLAYYNVLVAKEQLRLQESTVNRLRENLRENRARQRAGLVEEYNVMQVEVQLANQEPLLTEARYAVDQAYRELKMVMGIPLELQFAVQGNLSAFDILSEEAEEEANRHIKQIDRMNPYRQVPPENLMEMATELRGDIRVLDNQEDLTEKEIQAIKSRFLPTLSATYDLNWQANDPGSPNFFGDEEQRVRTQSLMINLSIPIFQGFQRSANLQIAQIGARDLELQREDAVRRAKNEIQSSREAVNQAIETSRARERAVQQAREGYERARKRLENGIGSQIDVTEAELQLREAEANYAQMVYSYLTAKAQYDLATGRVPFVDKKEPEIN